MSTDFRHPIRVVARRTGLSPHVIRAWERRYGAITPLRTPTNRRLYSDEDILRLQLLRRAIRSGRSIGQIALLSTEELQALISTDHDRTVISEVEGVPAPSSPSVDAVLQTCFTAAEELNAVLLEETLARASVSFSQPVVFDEIILPLMHGIGERWHRGELKIVNEHLASAVVRNFLGGWVGTHGIHPSAPILFVATLSGQVHELGALSVVATANTIGWRAIYLGPNLPAEEIAAGVNQRGAAALALSIVHPPDDPHIRQELQKLRQLLPPDALILVGGRAASSYGDVLSEIGAVQIEDLKSFRERLEQFQQV